MTMPENRQRGTATRADIGRVVQNLIKVTNLNETPYASATFRRGESSATLRVNNHVTFGVVFTVETSAPGKKPGTTSEQYLTIRDGAGAQPDELIEAVHDPTSKDRATGMGHSELTGRKIGELLVFLGGFSQQDRVDTPDKQAA